MRGRFWIGQLVSNLGSAMTAFGLGIWVYQETGSALQLALIVAAARVPMLLISPFAGALIDRWDRRNGVVMMKSFERGHEEESTDTSKFLDDLLDATA